MRFLLVVFAASLCNSWAVAARAVVNDVSIQVQVAPETFWPGSSQVITMTLHNDGPDVAGGGSNLAFPVDVLQRGITLPNQSTSDIPYNVFAAPSGCRVGWQVVGPLPDLSFILIWSYHFQPIPAGGSRTCTIPITFYDHATTNIPTHWWAYRVPSDPDWSNNLATYEFVRGSPPPPRPVPLLSITGAAVLTMGLALAAGFRLSRLRWLCQW